MSASEGAVTDEPRVLDEGEQIAPGYVVVEHLSRGEALDVYAVFSERHLCSAVAKTVRPDRAHVDRVRRRLLREGRLVTTLAHPHLVRGLEVIEGPAPVVITETLLGCDLEELIEWRRRRLPATDLAHLGQQLASALQHVHTSGHLHLDVRPANVMAHGGKATLIDLSIAQAPGRVPAGYGTREYRAPEQTHGGLVTTATDVWGLGATLFHAATGAVPQPGADVDRSGRAGVGVPAVATLRPRLDRTVAGLIDECLTADPGRRPSIVEVHGRLGRFLAG